MCRLEHRVTLLYVQGEHTVITCAGWNTGLLYYMCRGNTKLFDTCGEGNTYFSHVQWELTFTTDARGGGNTVTSCAEGTKCYYLFEEGGTHSDCLLCANAATRV